MTSSTTDVVRGDATGLVFPAHPDALRADGPQFLTEAFQAFGALAHDNRVTHVTFEPCPGGSTGQKLFLTVEYERPDPGLLRDLFAKFSRDFGDPIRDRMRHEMEPEVRFAQVSRLPGFPIRVPEAYFADYEHATGTGLLITERIWFGRDGIEPQHGKTLDHELDDPLAYYRVVLTALARLAAAHKSGRLAPDIDARFPFDPNAGPSTDKIPYDEAQLRALVGEYAAFARQCPQLLPENLRSEAFFAKLEAQVGGFLEHEDAIWRFLRGDPDLVALCHWNAHIDNAWFWRDATGALQCGLIDWGRVRQMNLAFAFWGCVNGAPLEVWNDRLDELLALVTTEYARHGGPQVDPEELKLHLDLYAAMMGLAWMMVGPSRILYRLPEAVHASGPEDPVFRKSEQARNFMHIGAVFLNLWQRHDFGASLDRMLARVGG